MKRHNYTDSGGKCGLVKKVMLPFGKDNLRMEFSTVLEGRLIS